VFHVELRKFPNVARAFNLTRAELEERILAPWVSGGTLELDDRTWEPGRSKLAIYEGPALGSEEIGMGRGWANATRRGHDVTAGMVAEARRAARSSPALEELKREIAAGAAAGHATLREVVELAGERHPQSLASERLALAERAVWELLHAGELRLTKAGRPLPAEEWRPTLLSWGSWSEDGTAVEPGP
jgi:hypothetical protein